MSFLESTLNSICRRWGIIFKTLISSLFPLTIILFSGNRIDIGYYGEFVAQSSFWIPFVSLGQMNIFIVENKTKVDFSKLIGSLLVVSFLSPLILFFPGLLSIKFSVIMYWIYFPFHYLNMVRNTHHTLEIKSSQMVLHELINFLPSFIYVFFFEDWSVVILIEIRIVSIVISGLLFLITIKSNLIFQRPNIHDIRQGILFIPSKMLNTSFDYFTYSYVGNIGIYYQSEFFKWRKYGGLFLSLLELKNQMMLKFAYSLKPLRILRSSWIYLDLICFIAGLLLMKINHSLGAIVVSFSILNVSIGVNYIVFFRKDYVGLYLINGLPVLLLLGLFFLHLNVYWSIVIFSLAKLLISIFIVYDKRSLAE